MATSGLSPWFITVLTCLFTYISKERQVGERMFNFPDLTLNDTYDFIIVGAGSAGSVVANRLSEVGYWKILLIEAGGEEDTISDTPILAPTLWNTDKDWNYSTVEQKFACRESNGICVYPRGHVLGGSSTINFLNYVRGNKYDYDKWEQLGNNGWSYNEVLPYFLKSEDIRMKGVESKFHSRGGYLTIESGSYFSPLQKSFIKASETLGFKLRDYNGDSQTGVGYIQYTMRNGMRCSTAKSYLSNIKERPNLHISKRTLALKVNLNINNNRVESIIVLKDNVEFLIKARKEVIVSAGAINSPKLLMLSGIGPKDHLNDLDIPIKLDLPVGDNLRDHSVIYNVFKINETITLTKSKIEHFESIMEYAKENTGPLSSIKGMELVGFFPLVNRSSELPDIQVYMTSFTTLDNEEPLILVTENLLRPKSMGSVRLRSSDPKDPPVIDPKYHEHSEDFEKITKGCKIVLELMSTEAMSKYNPQLMTNGTKCEGLTGKEYCICSINNFSETMFHPVSTAKMSKDGVVDETLKVWGIDNLRVVDASVMPDITSGNTNAPVIMIAEKASDIIKNDWNVI